MAFLNSLLGLDAYFYLPANPNGWLLWFGLLLVLCFFLWLQQRLETRRRRIFSPFVLGLFLLTPLAAVLAGILLPADFLSPPLGTPLLQQQTVLMLFSALPWLVAANMLGPLPAAVMAGLSGSLTAYFISHSFFVPLNYAISAAVFSFMVRQRSNEPYAKLLRRPLLASLLVTLLYMLLFFVTTPFLWNYPFWRGADYALSQLIPAVLVFLVPLLIGSPLAEALKKVQLPRLFGEGGRINSNTENNMAARLISTMAPLILALIVFLFAIELIIANRASRQTIDTQLRTTAESVAVGLPQALQTGEDLVRQMAQEDILASNAKPGKLKNFLKSRISQFSYYDQFTLLNGKGEPIIGYPEENAELVLTQEEYVGIQLAGSGVDLQMYSLPPASAGGSGRFSYIASAYNEKGNLKTILVAHASLDSNPFIQPLITSLNELTQTGGEGMLLDRSGLIIYHTDKSFIGQPYQGELTLEESTSILPSPEGGRQLVYFKPVAGQPWSVVTLVPAKVAQRASMELLLPMVATLAFALLIGFLVLRFGLKDIAGSLDQLSEEAAHIAEGNLDRPVRLNGDDEIGQLGKSFEDMRQSLKTRLEEVSKLLSVTQGVASALELEYAIKPILEGALNTGASSARIVLTKEALSEYEDDSKRQFGLGPSSSAYGLVDDQVMALTQENSQVILTSPARAGLATVGGQPLPASLMAFALINESDYFGALWVGYDEPRQFHDEEVRFMATVAGQAALAAANARLYTTAFLGHQRLQAILDSTPDPVLVTDHHDQLLLANASAQELFAGHEELQGGEAIETIVRQGELLNLFQSRYAQPQTTEVEFNDKKVYRATVSPVLVDNKVMGRVCVLSDITQFKEVDALKSEFVSTVSHDLRSPLTLMQGYATMLQMVGDLNPQQTSYVEKINTGVDRMTRLVNNLLDLGRIEAGVGLQVEEVSVTDTLQQVIEALQLQATQKKITLTLETPEQIIPNIEADQALLQQALHNLIDNAIKYTESDGKVTVKLTPRIDDLLVEVKDTGTGIAPVDVPRVFDRFFRGAGEHGGEKGGSGLGLAIVKSIAEKHAGSVWLESQLGKGSTFYINIPLRQKH